MAALGVKGLEELYSDDLWYDIEEIMLPAIVEAMTQAFILGWYVGQAEMSAIRREKAVGSAAQIQLWRRYLEEFIAELDINTAGAAGMDTTQTLQTYIAVTYASPFWASWSTDQRNMVRNAVNMAMQQGLQPRQAARLTRFGETMESLFGPRRARLIAATEITNIMGIGSQAVYKRSGVTRWEWRTSEDRRVCMICEARDGVFFPIDTPFGSAHPACRCWPVPYPSSIKPAIAEAPPPPTPAPAGEGEYPPGFPEEFKRRGKPMPADGFETPAAAKKWFKERYPWITNANFTNATMSTLNASLRNFELLARDFPWVTAKLRNWGMTGVTDSVGKKHGTVADAYAYATLDGSGIWLNPKWYSDKYRGRGFASNRASDVASGFKAKGTADAGGTSVHEFGHLVDGHWNPRRYTEYVPGKYVEGKWVEGGWQWREYGEGIGPRSHATDLFKRLVTDASDTSSYGRSSAPEGFAEAFSEWFHWKYKIPGGTEAFADLGAHAKALDAFFTAYPPSTWNPAAPPEPVIAGEPSPFLRGVESVETLYRTVEGYLSEARRSAENAKR